MKPPKLPTFRRLPRLHPKRWFKLLPLVTAVLLLGVTAGSIFFLNRYFYQTIAQLRVVSVLRAQVAFSQVDLPLYQKVFAAIEGKKQFDAKDLESLRDPFQPLPPAPADPSLEQVNATP